MTDGLLRCCGSDNRLKSRFGSGYTLVCPQCSNVFNLASDHRTAMMDSAGPCQIDQYSISQNSSLEQIFLQFTKTDGALHAGSPRISPRAGEGAQLLGVPASADAAQPPAEGEACTAAPPVVYAAACWFEIQPRAQQEEFAGPPARPVMLAQPRSTLACSLPSLPHAPQCWNEHASALGAFPCRAAPTATIMMDMTTTWPASRARAVGWGARTPAATRAVADTPTLRWPPYGPC
eukprot:gene42351-58122_t